MKYLIPIFFVFLLFSACKKATEENPVIVFEGFTLRDIYGGLISEDVTDWRYEDSWTSLEHSLFNDIQKPLCPVEEAPQWDLIAYPNPITTGYMSIELLDNTRFSYRLVDNEFNVIRAHDSIHTNIIHFAFDRLNIYNDTLRMYYKISRDNCEWRGHGDILFQME